MANKKVAQKVIELSADEVVIYSNKYMYVFIYTLQFTTSSFALHQELNLLRSKQSNYGTF